MVKPRSRTSNKKHISRNGKPRKTDKVDNPKDRRKIIEKRHKKEEAYWASLAGEVIVTKIEKDEATN